MLKNVGYFREPRGLPCEQPDFPGGWHGQVEYLGDKRTATMRERSDQCESLNDRSLAVAARLSSAIVLFDHHIVAMDDFVVWFFADRVGDLGCFQAFDGIYVAG